MEKLEHLHIRMPTAEKKRIREFCKNESKKRSAFYSIERFIREAAKLFMSKGEK